MIGRLFLLAFGLVIGTALSLGLPSLQQLLPGSIAFWSQPAAQTPEPAAENAPGAADDRPSVRLSAEAIEAAGIEVAPVQSGTIAHRIVVHGTIVPHADRIAHVAVKLSGTVAELRKRIGDPVAMDEVLAVLESREVADAKSEYLAARVTNELQQQLLERDTILWERKVLESLDPVQPRFAVPAVAADRSSRPIRPFWRTCNACSSRRRLAIRCVR
jgi:cobalt-zinc-cadmium efflux system membrane fusion protein